jgi:hypothetical protein
MNAEIRSIMRDDTMSPAARMERVRAIHARSAAAAVAAVAAEPRSPRLSCEHYTNHVDLCCEDCGTYHACRHCHDTVQDHVMDHTTVTTIRCRRCLTVQGVSNRCKGCRKPFADYACKKCRIWCAQRPGYHVYHCTDCGICRVSETAQRVAHCATCRTCMPEDHVCIPRGLPGHDCPVCLESLFASKQACTMLRCGHVAHYHCMVELVQSGTYTCPLCKKSVVDMAGPWEAMRQEIAATPMPAEHRHQRVVVSCNDCLERSETTFHVVGLACQACHGFNTQRVADA